MIWFLSGPESYLLTKRVRELKKEHEATHVFFDIDCEDMDANIVRREISAPSLFFQKKLFLFKNPLTSPVFEGVFSVLQHEIVKTTEHAFLFVQQKNYKETEELATFFKKADHVESFPYIQGKQLREFVQKEVKENNGSITSKATEELIIRTQGDIWGLAQEVQKLLAYTKGKEIQEKDVVLLVHATESPDMFLMLNAISAGDKKTALRSMVSHVAQGENPIYLFSRIVSQAKTVLCIKEAKERGMNLAEIASALSLEPFVVKKGVETASRFSFEALRALYSKVGVVDIALKTGRGDPEHVLYLFVAHMATR